MSQKNMCQLRKFPIGATFQALNMDDEFTVFHVAKSGKFRTDGLIECKSVVRYNVFSKEWNECTSYTTYIHPTTEVEVVEVIITKIKVVPANTFCAVNSQ